MSHQRAVAGPPVAVAALKGLCPRCGSATLFDGMAQVAPACTACGMTASDMTAKPRRTDTITAIP